ncbi:MAG: hypothetical protein ABSE73_08185 [Planctomycetota bacterium]
MKYILKKSDGTETVLTHDQLVISYNRREIDSSSLAKAEGQNEWVKVGVLLGVESTDTPRATSLVKCPACGKGVSSNAPACPGCGEPMRSSVEQASGALNPKDPVHFIGLIIVSLMILVTIIYIVKKLNAP